NAAESRYDLGCYCPCHFGASPSGPPECRSSKIGVAISSGGGPTCSEAQDMSDRLLEWMSYRVSGRRGDFPEELLAGESAWWVMGDLSALGHIETGPDGSWRITPPVLAEIEDDQRDARHAILCGARTRKL